MHTVGVTAGSSEFLVCMFSACGRIKLMSVAGSRRFLDENILQYFFHKIKFMCYVTVEN